MWFYFVLYLCWCGFCIFICVISFFSFIFFLVFFSTGCWFLFFYWLFFFFFFFFFFSSRRRHTRLTCDWSSDVCSSDLAGNGAGDDIEPLAEALHRHQLHCRQQAENAGAERDPGRRDAVDEKIGRASCRERV